MSLRIVSPLLLALAACGNDEPAHTQRSVAPDVVVVLADDFGWGDVRWNAPHDVATPNLERLAREGLVFERYYTAPLCTPARAGLLTGRSPLRMGLVRNLGDQDEVGLPAGETLLVESFRRAGFATSLCGKWHLGDAPEQRPTARGFDHAYGCLGGWVDYATHERNRALDWQRDGADVRESGWTTELIAREAIRTLEHRDPTKPLLLYVSFNAPHPPLAAPPGTHADSRDPRATLRLVVADLDRAIGELVAAIERSPRARDTLVFFASDNGADPRFGGSNGELRGGKATVFEGGIRVPALLWSPGRITAGKSQRVITNLDVLPTLAGAAGVALEAPQPLDGRALWHELDESAPQAPQVFAIERNDERHYAVVGQRFKLIETLDAAGSARDEFFDLDADPREARDVAAEHARELGELRTELAPWLAMPRVGPRERKR